MKQAQDDVKNQTSEFLTYASEVWYLNYYLSYDVCVFPSVCSSKMDQIRKFGEQTSRILEFKP